MCAHMHRHMHARKDSWFELTLIRTSVVNTIPDDMSAVMERALTVFFSTDSHNFASSGINVEFPDGGTALIMADIGIVIADAEALHAIYGCKGTSGLKPCLCCINVYNHNTPRRVVEADRSGMSVYHSCSDTGKLKFTTPAILLSIIQKLASARQSDRAELETNLGWKFMPRGVMFNPVARQRMCPSTKVTFDWAHVFFVNGVFNSHAGLVLHKLRALRVNMDVFVQYVRSFRWPHAVSSSISPKDALSANRFKNSLAAKSLKATASEGLSLIPVMAMFFQHLALSHHDDEVRRHAACFVMLALVVSMIIRSGRGLTNHVVLQHRVETYLKEFVQLYGYAAATPKFHMLLHFAFYVRILNCLVHERKHKSVKRYANIHYNTRGDWDRSVLREVTCDHIARLVNAPMIKFSATPGLDSGRVPSAKLYRALVPLIGRFAKDQVNVSRVARINMYEKVNIRDVVRIGTIEPAIIGQVKFHVSVTDGSVTQCVTIVEEFSVESTHPRFWKCRKSGNNTVVETGDIHCALIFGGNEGGVLTVLQPLHATNSLDI